MPWGRLAALLFMVVIVGAPVTAEPWLESRHDALRSGHTTDPGPEYNETAFKMRLDGPRGLAAVPIILDGAAYVLTTNLGAYQDYGYNATSRNAVWRIDLATGHPEVAFDYGHSGFWGDQPTMLSDGRHLFLVASGRVEAYDTVTREGPRLVWSRPPTLAMDEADEWGWFCNPATIAESVLYLGCIELTGGRESESRARSVSGISSFVAAVPVGGLADAEGGWDRPLPPTRPHDTEGAGQGEQTDSCALLRDNIDGGSVVCPALPLLLGHSVVEGRLIAVIATGAVMDILLPGSVGPTNEAAIMEPALVAFDVVDGTTLWTRHHPPRQVADGAIESAAEPEYKPWDRIYKSEVTGAEGFLFSREPELVWLTAADGDLAAGPFPVSETDITRTATAPGFALRGDELYASSEQTIKRYDWRARTGVITGESLPTLDDGEFFTMPDLVVTGDTLFAKTAHLAVGPTSGSWGRFTSTENHIVAMDISASSFEERWRVPFDGGFSPNIIWLAFGVGDGVIVAHGMDGYVTVIGRTPASLQPSAAVDTDYVDTGERVSLDLGRTAAGSLGEATRFRVDWGDGASANWQDDPSFSHVYATAGIWEATVWVANDAGQSSAAPVVFHVGVALTENRGVLFQIFDRENQDVTFFVLGLAITAIGALWGVMRFRRRHRFLAREVDAVTLGLKPLGDRPEQAEAFLAERRGHAQALFTDGRLTAAEHAVLLRHIQDTLRALRLGDLDGPLGFLPYALVRELRDAVSDGQLNAREHDRLVSLVETDPWLSAKQKRDVKQHLHAWRTRDKG